MRPNELQINQGWVGLLYEDGVFIDILGPGVHKLRHHWLDRRRRDVTLVDVRDRSITIKGQEILTADKVAIRVSLLVYFRVKDPEAALNNVASYEDRIYEDVQLAARRFLANRNLEAILSDRNEISDAVRDEVRESATGYGVEILRADVKDLIFPGNLREIMNQVLETERRSEAKIIAARKDAEAQRIRTAAENEAALSRLEAEKLQTRLRAEAEIERSRLTSELELERAQLTRQIEVDAARALAEHPELRLLRELQALSEMARSGARFVVNLQADGLGRLLQANHDDST